MGLSGDCAAETLVKCASSKGRLPPLTPAPSIKRWRCRDSGAARVEEERGAAAHTRAQNARIHGGRKAWMGGCEAQALVRRFCRACRARADCRRSRPRHPHARWSKGLRKCCGPLALPRRLCHVCHARAGCRRLRPRPRRPHGQKVSVKAVDSGLAPWRGLCRATEHPHRKRQFKKAIAICCFWH